MICVFRKSSMRLKENKDEYENEADNGDDYKDDDWYCKANY